MSGHNGHCDWLVSDTDRGLILSFARELGVHPIIARILVARGISTTDSAGHYLAPSLDRLSNPFELEGMRTAVDRLSRAREQNECVLVFGDYDVDGIAGTALLVRALRAFGLDLCTFGMPNRQIEGYGLSPDRVDEAGARGISLIVTVDNGIAAHEAAARARELGIDLIVTDHHLIEGELPPAVAVINPKRQPEGYAGAEACGTAVAYHLARALNGSNGDLDLVALGTVADIVPLRGENRELVAAGLQVMAGAPRPGIRMLARVAGVDIGKITSEDIAFQLAPRINAGGRMSDGLAGLELLLTESEEKAAVLAEELDAANVERRALESQTLDEVLRELAATFHPGQRSIVLAREGWHRGVIGIVASRIQASYYRPVVLVALDGDGMGRGSGRSIAGFNIAEALSACEAHLAACGGHAAAAGLSIETGRFDAFREAFEAEAARRLPAGEIRRQLHIDAQVSLAEVDSKLVAQLDRLQPFGNANYAPLFCSYGVEPVPGSWRELRGGHLKVSVRHGSRVMDAIGFRMADRLAGLSGAHALDVAFSPQFNTWRGETTVQLVLKDIRACT